jgi:hypothetical protein
MASRGGGTSSVKPAVSVLIMSSWVHPYLALTECQAGALRGRLAAGESVTTLAREYGVNRQTVYNYAS